MGLWFRISFMYKCFYIHIDFCHVISSVYYFIKWFIAYLVRFQLPVSVTGNTNLAK